MSKIVLWRTYDDREPAWSPDGNRIAFVSNRTGRWQIYSMDKDGTDVRNLTRTTTRDVHPAWSPDGSKIAYATLRFGFWSICLVEAEGKAPSSIITNNPAVEDHPAWSPDGQRIAYHSNRNGTFDIWVCDVTGANQTPLTSDDPTDLSPAWSPDGKKIAYHSNRQGPGDEFKPGRQSVWVMEANGSNLRQLTHGPGDETSPAWSPDSSKIAFVADQGGRKTICVVDADGSNRTEAISLGSGCDNPAWSPQAEILAFDSDPEGFFRVQTAGVNGSGRVELSAESKDGVALAGAEVAAPVAGRAAPQPERLRVPPPESPTVRRAVTAHMKRTGRRGLASTIIRLLLLGGAVFGIYYGVSWALGRGTAGILVDAPRWTREETEATVTYLIRNDGRAGIIRTRAIITMDNGEKVESAVATAFGARRFRAGEEKTIREDFTIRSDRQIKDVTVEITPQPR